ncbi:MAG: hypothetical protein AAF694_12775 [Bacteroidota bacterium]
MTNKMHIRYILLGILAFSLSSVWAQSEGTAMKYVFHEGGMVIATPDDFDELHPFEFSWGVGKAEAIYTMDVEGKLHPFKGSKYASEWDKSSALVLQNIYQNVDMIIRPDAAVPGKMVLEYVIFPGGNPADISFDFNTSLFVNQKEGSVKVDNMVGSLYFSGIQAVQSVDGSEFKKIEADFSLNEEKLRLEVEKFEKTSILTLILDITYGSQLGGGIYTASAKPKR